MPRTKLVKWLCLLAIFGSAKGIYFGYANLSFGLTLLKLGIFATCVTMQKVKGIIAAMATTERNRHFVLDARALIVDSVDLSRNLTQIFVEAAGCLVASTPDLDEVANILGAPGASDNERVRFDLVVINTRNVLNQLKLVQEIRSTADRNPKIISIIPSTRIGSIFDLFDAGSSVIITSPFDPTEFIAVVQRCVKRSQVNTIMGSSSRKSGDCFVMTRDRRVFS